MVYQLTQTARRTDYGLRTHEGWIPNSLQPKFKSQNIGFFCRNNGWIIENMDKGLTVPKWVPKPKNYGFQWKKAVRSPWFNLCLLHKTWKIGAQEVGQLDSSPIAEICYLLSREFQICSRKNWRMIGMPVTGQCRTKGLMHKHFQCIYAKWYTCKWIES